MTKKIKVIELLNEIANGEEVPSNIKVEDKEYCLDGSTYYTVGEDDEDLFCLESYTNTLDFLKAEVEILEDTPKKIEKIKVLKYNTFNKKQKLLYENMDTLANKLNEVIDKLNEMESKTNG